MLHCRSNSKVFARKISHFILYLIHMQRTKKEENDMLKIGSHVSMSGKDMFLNSVKEAAGYGANTFMLYTGAPQNTRRKPIEELNIEAG